jgi:hypothetical protein
VVTRIVLLVVVGLLTGYFFYSTVNTTSFSIQGLMQGKTTAPEQPEEKNDLRTTVSTAPENKPYSAPERTEIAKPKALVAGTRG